MKKPIVYFLLFIIALIITHQLYYEFGCYELKHYEGDNFGSNEPRLFQAFFKDKPNYLVEKADFDAFIQDQKYDTYAPALLLRKVEYHIKVDSEMGEIFVYHNGYNRRDNNLIMIADEENCNRFNYLFHPTDILIFSYSMPDDKREQSIINDFLDTLD